VGKSHPGNLRVIGRYAGIPYALTAPEWSHFTPRPAKWSCDLHPIPERATHSKTETWSRKDIERMFDIGRATAQTLMKAIGEI
jgi:hypothetical protein